MTPEAFSQALSNHKLPLTTQQVAQFKLYFKELVVANEQVNLTRITAEPEVYLKHFYDSLTPLLQFPHLFQSAVKLCDVGAGAGFPSIPLKILCPQLQVTIVDSLGKRLTFLSELIAKLGLQDVSLVHGRAEDVGQNPAYREQFDLVSARAVARMTVLSEYCLPLVKPGGYLIALKGPKAQSELQLAKVAISKLGGSVVEAADLTLPEVDEERTLVLIKKTHQTPNKYPRQAGTPARKPL
ncbi:MAG: 16S rRNA (guanine(527)-N(7))-methyltransferase RsmG [Lactobacillus sp.]|nr:16S rRNA (guanine(527)-N(7))-methyltransferase RsmG [Lactobacillus sp.]MDN6042646.1 16S rRNA (guanine(527)-N(7))-methyltransferase RsmG [Lactobacillus sp.]MDN6053006.1 16S rRNA (guanine(527)-N(7))-methyltransferase RsmG [Lactobacillus sp.]